ncbi:MAG: type II toxin-antitoxin system HigB family toxin [Saprospiraceae bacterium]|nr:type II toxin-antitoxin system HigB family toxin [Saprospiraceae bacterium]
MELNSINLHLKTVSTVRVVTPRRLFEFSQKHSQAKIPLLSWYEITKKAEWESFIDIKKDFNTVDYVGNNRYVFDIKGNDYRLIVLIIFVSRKVYIRFIGTHDEYIPS